MPSEPATLLAGCKINLYLHIGDKLPNGYHTLETIFLPLAEPHDILEIFQDEKASAREEAGLPGKEIADAWLAQRLRVDFSAKDINPERNTLTKAYAWYAAQTGFAPRLTVKVTKNIPHGAGLGGGSSDAAMLLLYLQEEAIKAGYTPLEPHALLEKSAAIGADVPFFLLGTTAQAHGVGEKLLAVPNPYAGSYLVLVCPPVSISTAWAFAALDALREARILDPQNILDLEDDNPASSLPSAFSYEKEKFEKKNDARLTTTEHQATYSFAHGALPGNDFEELVFMHYPQLRLLYKRLCETSAKVVRMSGTGSSFFAVYDSSKNAEKAVKGLARNGYSVYMQSI